MRNNFLLFILVLALSLITAPYLGGWYDKFDPQYSYGLFGVGRENAIFLTGFFVAYVIFVPLIFELLGAGSRKKWILWSLLPPALLWVSADFSHIYLPIAAAVAAYLVAKLIRFIVSKFKRPGLPMVIK